MRLTVWKPGLCVWAGGAALLLAACASTPLPPLNTRAPVVVTATVAPPAPPSPMLFPSLTPPPLQNRTPEPTLTPAPVLRPLTSGGCCVQPAFSPDGSQVWYVDKPDVSQPAGLWAVPVLGGPPAFVTDRLGIFSPDGTLVAYPQAGDTYIERWATGERWRVPAAGRAVAFSPDGTQIAWQTASSSINFDRRRVDLWVAAVDGSDARLVISLVGGGLAGWFPDGRLLATGSLKLNDPALILAVTPATGDAVEIAPAAHVRGLLLSPAGGWLAYQVSFSGDAAQDGLWLRPLAGGEPKRAPVFGAYRWRAEGRLLVVPLEAVGGSQRLVEVDAATGAAANLTDPRVTAFRIAAGDWDLAPDGRRLVFVNAADHNVWLLELP